MDDNAGPSGIAGVCRDCGRHCYHVYTAPDDGEWRHTEPPQRKHEARPEPWTIERVARKRASSVAPDAS